MNTQKASLIAYGTIALAVLIAVLAALGIRPADLTPEQIAAIGAVVTALAGLAHAKTDKAPPSTTPPQTDVAALVQRITDRTGPQQ